MSEARSCGRCGADETIRNPVRMALVDVEREARQDGYLAHAGLQVLGFLAIGPLSLAVHDLWAQVFALIR